MNSLSDGEASEHTVSDVIIRKYFREMNGCKLAECNYNNNLRYAIEYFSVSMLGI